MSTEFERQSLAGCAQKSCLPVPLPLPIALSFTQDNFSFLVYPRLFIYIRVSHPPHC